MSRGLHFHIGLHRHALQRSLGGALAVALTLSGPLELRAQDSVQSVVGFKDAFIVGGALAVIHRRGRVEMEHRAGAVRTMRHRDTPCDRPVGRCRTECRGQLSK